MRNESQTLARIIHCGDGAGFKALVVNTIKATASPAPALPRAWPNNEFFLDSLSRNSASVRAEYVEVKGPCVVAPTLPVLMVD